MRPLYHRLAFPQRVFSAVVQFSLEFGPLSTVVHIVIVLRPHAAFGNLALPLLVIFLSPLALLAVVLSLFSVSGAMPLLRWFLPQSGQGFAASRKSMCCTSPLAGCVLLQRRFVVVYMIFCHCVIVGSRYSVPLCCSLTRECPLSLKAGFFFWSWGYSTTAWSSGASNTTA